MKIQLVLLAVVTSLHGVFGLKRCSLVDGTPDPTYNLIKPCSRSKMTLVGSANTKTLQQCQRYAASKRALALNYNPSGKILSFEFSFSRIHNSFILKESLPH